MIGSNGAILGVEQWEEAMHIFDEALNCNTLERDSFLELACGGNAGLLHEVQALLAADNTEGHALDMGIFSRIELAEPKPGDEIDGWHLIRELGRGGMGVVFLGARGDQYGAVKVLKSNVSVQVSVNFEEEGRILDELNHPNVPKLLGRGKTEQGLPYLVMDYIEGQSLDVWCEKQNLQIRERLALFVRLCHVVNDIHENKLLHCDLKPDNILVDATGTLFLLDFGIARSLKPRPLTVGANLGVVMLTPGFSSPEQVKGLPLGKTCDVYALGIIIYKLLSGSLPFEIQDAIVTETTCEVACRPFYSMAHRRRKIRSLFIKKVNPSSFHRQLNDVVMTALQKDPDDRHANGEIFGRAVFDLLSKHPVADPSDAEMNIGVYAHRLWSSVGKALTGKKRGCA